MLSLTAIIAVLWLVESTFIFKICKFLCTAGLVGRVDLILNQPYKLCFNHSAEVCLEKLVGLQAKERHLTPGPRRE